MSDLFTTLIQKAGAYNLPFLIHLYDSEGAISIRAVNDVDDVTYNGVTYSAAAFSYTPNADENGFDGGGSLEIALKESDYLVDLVQTTGTVSLDVVGIVNASGEVEPIKTWSHKYGTISVTRTSAKFTYEKDDRLEMTFPALIWDYQNNRGNS